MEPKRSPEPWLGDTRIRNMYKHKYLCLPLNHGTLQVVIEGVLVLKMMTNP